MKPLYLGVFLDQTSQELFVKNFSKERGWKWSAHHMTIKFGLNRIDLEKAELGKEVSLDVMGPPLRDKNGMSVYVKGYKSDNKYPHITIQVAPEQSFKYSNYQWDNWGGETKSLKKLFTVKGRVGFWDAKRSKPSFSYKEYK